MTSGSSNRDFMNCCFKIKLHLSNYYNDINFLAPAAKELDVTQVTKKSLVSSHVILRKYNSLGLFEDGKGHQTVNQADQKEMVSPFLELFKGSIDVAHWDAVLWWI